MTLGSILLIFALLLFTAAFVGRPLVTGAGRHVTDYERHLSELLAERDHILAALSDLDMDNALEKIPAEDYVAHRAELLRQGAAILREIDTLTGEGMTGTGAELAPKEAGDAEEELEAAVARLRSGGGKPTGRFCPQCGKQVVADDRFCSHCGATLVEEDSPA